MSLVLFLQRQIVSSGELNCLSWLLREGRDSIGWSNNYLRILANERWMMLSTTTKQVDRGPWILCEFMTLYVHYVIVSIHEPSSSFIPVSVSACIRPQGVQVATRKKNILLLPNWHTGRSYTSGVRHCCWNLEKLLTCLTIRRSEQPILSQWARRMTGQ